MVFSRLHRMRIRTHRSHVRAAHCELARRGDERGEDGGDGDQPIDKEIQSDRFSAQLQDSVLREKLMATLSGAFGLLAGLLATPRPVRRDQRIWWREAAQQRSACGWRLERIGRARDRLVLREAILLVGVGLAAGVVMRLWAAGRGRAVVRPRAARSGSLRGGDGSVDGDSADCQIMAARRAAAI